MSGSLSIAGASDGVILLYKSTEEEGHCVELKTVPRDGTPIHYLLRDTKDEVTGYKSFKKIKEYGVDTSVIKIERRILRFLSKLIDKEESPSATKYQIAEEISENSAGSSFNLALDRLSESAQILEEKSSIENVIENVYSIPFSSPWRKLGCSAVGNYPEFEAAEELLSCKSKEEVSELTKSWNEKFGEKFKHRVWAVLNDSEQLRVYSVHTPPKFTEGTWVRDSDNNVHMIKSLSYDKEKSTWSYSILGKTSPYTESELQKDVDYTVKSGEF
jgi:hypothetical protein